MSERTEAELRQAIAETNAAIQKLIRGERLRALTVGSGEFQRRYSFAEITLDNLRDARDSLQKELDRITSQKGLAFRTSYTHVTWDKGF